MKSLSVLVADHHPLFAEGIRSALSLPSNQINYQVIAVARTAGQVEGYLKEYRADILLLDTSLPDANEPGWFSSLKSIFPALRTLIIAQQNDAGAVQSVLRKGADGYLLKTASKDELRNAIREVSEGRQFIGRGVVSAEEESAKSLNGYSDTETWFARKYHLTKREVEIVRHIGQALTNKEIGDRLFISDQTVSVHRKNIMRKLRVNSTASLIKMVFEHQIPMASL